MYQSNLRVRICIPGAYRDENIHMYSTWLEMTEFQELNIGGFLILLMDTIHIKIGMFWLPYENSRAPTK